MTSLDSCLMEQAKTRLEEDDCVEDPEDSSKCKSPVLYKYRELLNAPAPIAEADLMCGSIEAIGCYSTSPPEIRVDIEEIFEHNQNTNDPWHRIYSTAEAIIHERLHHTGWRHEEQQVGEMEHGHKLGNTEVNQGIVTTIIFELWRGDDTTFDFDCFRWYGYLAATNNGRVWSSFERMENRYPSKILKGR